MKRGLISAVAAVGVMAALVVAPIESASAYPPGTAMTVSASPSQVSVGQNVTATASNVKPGCRVEFEFGDRSARATATGGSATVTIKAPSRTGSYRLWAKCSHGERASTVVKVVGRGEVHGPDHVCVSKSFNVAVSNFAPNSRVSVVLRKSTAAGGSRGRTVSFSKSARTNSSGAATYRFKVNRTGVYVISAVASGQRAASAISVDKC
jgi:hypothetical protein